MEDNVRLFNGDCTEVMQDLIKDGVKVDLTVTSPPYDNLRTYNGTLEWNFDIFKKAANLLYNITADGGVVVWVVGDSTIKGDETGTSFKQALYFKEIGFKLLDTMIYSKGGMGAAGSNRAYWQDFEYMFVFSKGKNKTFNPIMDRLNKAKPSIKLESQGHRFTSGEIKPKRIIERKKFGKRFNIWQYHEHGTKTKHPAVFPERLAKDHILSWSNEGDLVLDPFMGSGTTGKMAVLNNRRFIGIEKVTEYFDDAKERIETLAKLIKFIPAKKSR